MIQILLRIFRRAYKFSKNIDYLPMQLYPFKDFFINTQVFSYYYYCNHQHNHYHHYQYIIINIIAYITHLKHHNWPSLVFIDSKFDGRVDLVQFVEESHTNSPPTYSR